MNTDTKIGGIHHITAIASSAAENLTFYEKILGLRLVKKTVNFDDPYTYHLYYGDSSGSPGTIMTFFPWEKLSRGKTGAGMVTATALSILSGSPDYWIKRLNTRGIKTKETERFGDRVIQFEDPHGLPLELIETPTDPGTTFRGGNPTPSNYSIVGFHSATTILHTIETTQFLLVNVMGMELHNKYQNRYRFKMINDRSFGHYYDVVVNPKAEIGRQGGGTVHHIAFRTPTNETQIDWQKTLRQNGFSVTPVRDRKYFKSIYFSEPGGVLFEIATDPPGFSVDESHKNLGQDLKLPDQYEPMRAEIENRLPRLHSTEFVHQFIGQDLGENNGPTIVALHGTGGNEHDLISAAKSVCSTAVILSPRGKISENGMHRFFRRLAQNIFDEHDVVKRSHELADFLIESASRYERQAEHLIGLGYSNGANIAASIMFLRPEIFSKAILFRPMLPLQDPPKADLSEKEILILRGQYDSTIPSESTNRLIKALREAGARVDTRETEAGHELTADDLDAAKRWLSCDIELVQMKAVG